MPRSCYDMDKSQGHISKTKFKDNSSLKQSLNLCYIIVFQGNVLQQWETNGDKSVSNVWTMRRKYSRFCLECPRWGKSLFTN